MPSFLELLQSLRHSLRGLFNDCLESFLILKIRLIAHWSAFTRQEFRYQPLHAHQLRVLSVLPPLTTRRDEPIRCTIDHISLQEYTAEYRDWESRAGQGLRRRPHKARLAWAEYMKSRQTATLPEQEALSYPSRDAARYSWGDYIALSYCWGSDGDKPSRWILLNDRLFKVTENLEAALQFIRTSGDLTTFTTQHTKLWVDAICINQSDGNEAQHEIRRMKEIYGGAMGVLIHLGAEDEDSSLGIDVLQRTAAHVTQNIIERGITPGTIINQDEDSQKEYRALMKVLCRPYWNRLWILQELAMGDGTTAMGCGNRKFYFEEVVLATKFLWHNLEAIAVQYVQEVGGYAAFNSSTWVILFADRLRDLSRNLEDAQSVTYAQLQDPLLNLSQNAQAKLMHDKVFGLLAIMPERVAAEIDSYVNYNIPVDEVYVAFSKAIITSMDDLDVIFTRTLEQTMKPSWATDWRLPSDRVSLLHDWHTYGYKQFDTAYAGLHDMIEASHKARADGGRKTGFEILDQSSILNCSTILLGQIDGLAPDMNALSGLVFSEEEHIQPQHHHNPYGDDEATKRALIHTLFANPAWGDAEDAALFQIPWLSGENYPTNLNTGFFIDDTFRDNCQLMHELGWDSFFTYGNFLSFELFRRRIGRFLIGGKRFQDYFVQEITPFSLPEDRVHLDLAKVVGGHLGRRLITLTTGHFGLAPMTARRGDGVYVILGCSLPVVLRPVANTTYFGVVGECYVEGFARGEAVMGLDGGRYELLKLSLC